MAYPGGVRLLQQFTNHNLAAVESAPDSSLMFSKALPAAEPDTVTCPYNKCFGYQDNRPCMSSVRVFTAVKLQCLVLSCTVLTT